MQKFETQLQEHENRDEPRERRWTREEYYRLFDAGVFDEQRVELIEGIIIEMAPQRLSHRHACELVDRYLRKAFAQGFRICGQFPFSAFGDSEPEPDIAVILGEDIRAETKHPDKAVLIVEVSETSILADRKKARIYSASNVPEYWIVNLKTRSLEVYREPIAAATEDAPPYASTHIYSAGDTIAPLANPNASIKVADLLP